LNSENHLSKKILLDIRDNLSWP